VGYLAVTAAGVGRIQHVHVLALGVKYYSIEGGVLIHIRV
jgi:hypothetical protein